MLEDQGEDLYRLDRLLTTLRLSGQLEKLAGLVFGDFGPNLATKALRNLLLGLAESCPGPVAWAPYFGHGQENRPWPVGAEAELSLTAAEGYLAFFPSV
jgi:muramoyltetrapeptide carboxypeptidase